MHELPLADEEICLILMHRDVHFEGRFDLMIGYYEAKGKGVQPDFELPTIRELAEWELQTEQNLAPLILSEDQISRIVEAKQAYKSFRNQATTKKPSTDPKQLIAHLILSEEEEPEEVMEALVLQKALAVPALIEVLRSEDLHDPVFPGYGKAPILAARCLGRIGDKRALFSLFEAIDEGDFFDDEVVLHAFKEMGEEGKQFLMRVVKKEPLNEDNERAAIALEAFENDPEVAKECFSLLQDEKFQKSTPLNIYLCLCCTGLKGLKEQQAFEQMAKDPKTPSMLRQEMNLLIKGWKS